MSSDSAPERIPTGLPFLDRPLHGGHIPEGVHGLLGPIGIGKTTLGAMIVGEGALRQRRLAGEPGGGGVWLFINLDDRADKIKDLALCQAGGIPRQFGLDIQPIDFYATGPQEYELERADILRRPDGHLPLQRERLEIAVPAIDNHMRVIDLRFAHFGNASRPVDAILRAICATSHGIRVAGIVIDFAGAAVSQFLRDSGSARWEAVLLREFARDCRDLLVDQFHCPVWVTHQMNGDANDPSALTPRSHTEGSWCRRFGDHLDACFVLGMRDPTSHCFQMRCTKAPLEPPDKTPTILRIDSDFTIRESTEHALDVSTHRIVETDSRKSIHIDPRTLAALKRAAGNSDHAE